MISADLNQLLKKNKTASTLPPLQAPSVRPYLSCLFLLALVSSPPCPLPLLNVCTIMRASHVEKRDYLRHGIENAARASLSDARLPRFWSGFRFDIVPFRLSPSSSIFPVAADPPSPPFFPLSSAVARLSARNRRNGKSTTRPGQGSRNWSCSGASGTKSCSDDTGRSGDRSLYTCRTERREEDWDAEPRSGVKPAARGTLGGIPVGK